MFNTQHTLVPFVMVRLDPHKHDNLLPRIRAWDLHLNLVSPLSSVYAYLSYTIPFSFKIKALQNINNIKLDTEKNIINAPGIFSQCLWGICGTLSRSSQEMPLPKQKTRTNVEKLPTLLLSLRIWQPVSLRLFSQPCGWLWQREGNWTGILYLSLPHLRFQLPPTRQCP